MPKGIFSFEKKQSTSFRHLTTFHEVTQVIHFLPFGGEK